jgi:hypothetical protein
MLENENLDIQNENQVPVQLANRIKNIINDQAVIDYITGFVNQLASKRNNDLTWQKWEIFKICIQQLFSVGFWKMLYNHYADIQFINSHIGLLNQDVLIELREEGLDSFLKQLGDDTVNFNDAISYVEGLLKQRGVDTTSLQMLKIVPFIGKNIENLTKDDIGDIITLINSNNTIAFQLKAVEILGKLEGFKDLITDNQDFITETLAEMPINGITGVITEEMWKSILNELSNDKLKDSLAEIKKIIEIMVKQSQIEKIINGENIDFDAKKEFCENYCYDQNINDSDLQDAIAKTRIKFKTDINSVLIKLLQQHQQSVNMLIDSNLISSLLVYKTDLENNKTKFNLNDIGKNLIKWGLIDFTKAEDLDKHEGAEKKWEFIIDSNNVTNTMLEEEFLEHFNITNLNKILHTVVNAVSTLDETQRNDLVATIDGDLKLGFMQNQELKQALDTQKELLARVVGQYMNIEKSKSKVFEVFIHSSFTIAETIKFSNAMNNGLWNIPNLKPESISKFIEEISKARKNIVQQQIEKENVNLKFIAESVDQTNAKLIFVSQDFIARDFSNCTFNDFKFNYTTFKNTNFAAAKFTNCDFNNCSNLPQHEKLAKATFDYESFKSLMDRASINSYLLNNKFYLYADIKIEKEGVILSPHQAYYEIYDRDAAMFSSRIVSDISTLLYNSHPEDFAQYKDQKKIQIVSDLTKDLLDKLHGKLNPLQKDGGFYDSKWDLNALQKDGACIYDSLYDALKPCTPEQLADITNRKEIVDAIYAALPTEKISGWFRYTEKKIEITKENINKAIFDSILDLGQDMTTWALHNNKPLSELLQNKEKLQEIIVQIQNTQNIDELQDKNLLNNYLDILYAQDLAEIQDVKNRNTIKTTLISQKTWDNDYNPQPFAMQSDNEQLAMINDNSENQFNTVIDTTLLDTKPFEKVMLKSAVILLEHHNQPIIDILHLHNELKHQRIMAYTKPLIENNYTQSSYLIDNNWSDIIHTKDKWTNVVEGYAGWNANSSRT